MWGEQFRQADEIAGRSREGESYVDALAALALAVPAIAVGLSLALLGERAGPAVLVSIVSLIIGMGVGIYGTRRRNRPAPN